MYLEYMGPKSSGREGGREGKGREGEGRGDGYSWTSLRRGCRTICGRGARSAERRSLPEAFSGSFFLLLFFLLFLDQFSKPPPPPRSFTESSPKGWMRGPPTQALLRRGNEKQTKKNVDRDRGAGEGTSSDQTTKPGEGEARAGEGRRVFL